MTRSAALELEHFLVTWGAIAVLFLVVMERRVSPNTRRRWSSFILRTATGRGDVPIATTSEFATTFIQNTIFRYFGPNPWSLRALAKSVGLSAVSVCTLLVIYFELYHANMLQMIHDDIAVIWYGGGFTRKLYAVFAGAIVLLTDYSSYLVTYYLMRYAAGSRSIRQMMFLAIIDSFTSVYVFMLIFPAALVALYLGFYTASYRVPALYGIGDLPGEVGRGAGRYAVDSMFRFLDSQNDRAAWYNFLASERDEIGALASEIMLSAEIEQGGALGDPVHGTNPVDPGDMAIVALSGLLRYKGLKASEVKDFLCDHMSDAPNKDVSHWSCKHDLSWHTVGGTDARHQFVTAMWNGMNISIYRADYETQKSIGTGDIQLLLVKLMDLYQSGFSAVQQVQVGFWPTITLKPVSLKLFGLNFSDTDISETASWLQSVGGDVEPRLSDLYWDFCDEKVFVATTIVGRQCERRVVFLGLGYVATSLPVTMITRKQVMPFGLFFMTSASVTLVFYVGLFVFVLAGLGLRGISLLVPEYIRKAAHQDTRDRYVVQLLFIMSALVVTTILTVLAGD